MAELLLFAKAGELAQRHRDHIDGDTVQTVLRTAAATYGPGFTELLGYCSIMVDGDQVRDFTLPVTDRSEIAILPPVSGG